jgi:hypothetical protein
MEVTILIFEFREVKNVKEEDNKPKYLFCMTQKTLITEFGDVILRKALIIAFGARVSLDGHYC